MDDMVPIKPIGVDRYEDLIAFVSDRAGHDVRYAIDATKISEQLGWTPAESFESGIRKTVEWYLGNTDWCDSISVPSS